MSHTIPRPMIHKYLHFARHSLTTHLHSPPTDTFDLFCRSETHFEALRQRFWPFSLPTPPVGALRRHFWPFSSPCTTHFEDHKTTLWTISVTLQVCNQYSLIAQSAHLSHLKQHSPDNDQVTVQGVNIIAHLKVKYPSTEPSIGATPFQVRNTTHTWNRFYPITTKLQFQVLI